MSSLNIALVGNPNCGKTALFNRLTGSRQKVANYAGVTVERKEGLFRTPGGRSVRVLDLPGAYSLDAASPDEAITRDVCRGTLAGEAVPDLLVCVADATNLRLHLRFVLELRQLGRPMVLALNLMDVARRRGIRIDLPALQARLGLPVVETVAVKREGAAGLVAQLDAALPVPVDAEAEGDLHAQVAALMAECVALPATAGTLDDRLDRWLLHPVWGLMILGVVMFLMFQAVFSWAAPLQDALAGGISALGGMVSGAMPEGPLRSLVADGLFAGLGTVMEFLPQILLLFVFILGLEESGYLPRAAFLLDRPMRAAGLTGRSFIPLLSSFACAIPGIMATRSIQDPRDRLATILVAPLMTCSARLPVYTLLISAFIPRETVAGVFSLQGLVMFALYFAGVASALAAAWVMQRLRRGEGEHVLLLELPSYRLPNLLDLGIGLWERARVFLRRVTGIILALTVLLWFLSTYPAPPEGAVGPAIDYSLAGRIGRWMEPLFAPIGFNWQICIALIPGLAAREVAVAALATVYALSTANDAEAIGALSPLIAADWSLATALSLLVWYVYAPQCLSTIAVIKRETNSWKQAGIATGYLFALAYLASLVTYQLARALGA
ncbi:MAG TPA: ferrous iron transporter B [Arenimonas sp.]|uniref:ferrous iron transporter B n=1 Tax=Arenimonas sp. TaxID=1872635 RepID=UPI002D7FBC1E|nr:ferrous iron transporter B [Arenimonas sp.]HEU0152368.1 ferrous iron transporter B [Arenimonas sp.]